MRDHLLNFKESLENRATEQQWFELQQAQESCQSAFEGSKIIYPEMSQGSKFSMDSSGLYFNNKCFCINSDDNALLSYLNSKVVWFFLAGQASALRGGEWRLELRHEYMRRAPVPEGILTDPRLAELGGVAQSAASKRLDLQRAVVRRIPDLAPADCREPDGSLKLGRKLEAWWDLSFPEFRAEIRKRFKRDIPLGERTDWETWLAEGQREIARLSGEIERAEHEINAIVYGLFALTASG